MQRVLCGQYGFLEEAEPGADAVIFYRDLCYALGVFILLVALYVGTRPQQRRAAGQPEAEPAPEPVELAG